METDGRICDLVGRQRAFFDANRTKDLSFRIRQLKRLRSAIVSWEERITEALYRDLHKCETDSYASEIGFCLKELSHAIKNLGGWAKPVGAKGSPLFPLGGGFFTYEPYGLSLIIGPWNYPFGLVVSPLVAAIAAGNCAIVKPSEVSAHTSAVLGEMIGEHFGEEYVAVVRGDAGVARRLLKERFDYIFYTGGGAVGKKVMHAAADNLTPLTLELGGKNPCIVDKECDLEKTASRIAWGKFLNAGQTCVAPDYLLVDSKVREDLIKKLKERIQGFYGTDPSRSEEYCRIINRRHFDRLAGYLKESRILFGGEADAEGLYIAPALIEAPEDAKVMQEEIFGPLLPVAEYADIDEALRYVNSRPKPLAVYVFSDNKRLQEKIIENTSSGGVCINDTIIHIASPNLPFGGVGESGFGRYRGRHGFEAFSYKRSVFRNTTLFDVPRYPPYGRHMPGIVKRVLR
ncbi:MAG: aldehyde dehydrogenase [Candidatus Altiarchaeota archaeon]|nr:aldehyde dehydrogenase [Candidatus Altiarchaeota archaeon]